MKERLATGLTAVCLLALLWIGWRVEGIQTGMRRGAIHTGQIATVAFGCQRGDKHEIKTERYVDETVGAWLLRARMAQEAQIAECAR